MARSPRLPAPRTIQRKPADRYNTGGRKAAGSSTSPSPMNASVKGRIGSPPTAATQRAAAERAATQQRAAATQRTASAKQAAQRAAQLQRVEEVRRSVMARRGVKTTAAPMNASVKGRIGSPPTATTQRAASTRPTSIKGLPRRRGR